MNIVSMMIYSATTQTEATLTKLACTKPETTKQNHQNERNGCNDQNKITKTNKTAETTKQSHHYNNNKKQKLEYS